MAQREDTEQSSGRQLKLTRLIDEYDLKGLGAELERRWTADENRSSLRDLAEYFNHQLVEAAMTEAGMQPLDGEVANVYRLLTEDDVSGGEQTRTQRRLERAGLDVDALQEDFVTYQAVRTYLITERQAEYHHDAPTPQDEAQNIQQLRGRTVTVTESKLAQLRKRDDLTIGEFRTLVDITVICEDCDQQYEVTDLLETGSCACAEARET